MSDEERTEKTKGEAKVEGPQDFAEMCRRMASGEMPACCGPKMRDMMSRFMAQFQAKEEK